MSESGSLAQCVAKAVADGKDSDGILAAARAWMAPLVDPKPLDSDDYFLLSREWRAIRYRALEKHGARCQACGRTASYGIVINVDHIKPRTKYPELALDIENLQVLCSPCNEGKGNKFSTDWRGPAAINHAGA